MRSLPSGTVTFLFTDIEGSTKRWEENPPAMQLAFDRQEAILRHAIEANGGFAYKMIGDAFQAAFPTAPQALQAALDGQRALHSFDWPRETGDVRVRMALHTGTTEERGDDYVGPALNRVARLLAAGHGGQTLLTEPAFSLVRDVLPAGVTTLDMGEHRLKDLQRPEHVFQVVVPGLPSDFPPLRTLDSRPNNLPARQSSLVGRGEELAAAEKLLLKDNAGLLTLTGPGGVGKTRMALQIAAEVIDGFEDGAYVVDLTPLHDPVLVAAAIAQVLGIREVGGRPLVDSLKEHLRDKQLLLILDNFEHVVSAANLVAQLLVSAPRLRILTTSRAALHIRGEQEFAIPPLSLPDIGHLPSAQSDIYFSSLGAHGGSDSADALSRNEAVALFVERAQLVKPDFELTAQNASTIAQICIRLDGLPLAIELAAARSRLLPPRAMLERLEKRLGLLTGGPRDLPAHQQTMRNTIAWSYELLTVEEQRLFDCISVFAGGCTFEAVEAVCNPSARLELDTVEGMGALVDKSLLREEELRGELRFSMLETIREFGLDRLEASGEGQTVQRQYIGFFLKLAPEEGREWAYIEVQQKEWMDKVKTEQNNLRSAVEWSIKNDTEAALRFCSSLFWPWIMLGYLGELDKWLKQALALPDAESNLGYASTSVAWGVLAAFQRDYPLARRRLEGAISLLDSVSDKSLVSQALGFLAMSITMQEGSEATLSVTLDVTEHLVALVREAGDISSLITALMALGIARFFRGEYEAARHAFDEALAQYEVLGKNVFAARAMTMLGDIARIEGDYVSAGPMYERSLALIRDLEARNEIPSIMHSLGYVALAHGDTQRARMLFSESLTLHLELEDKGGIGEALAGFAAVARAEGELERSVLLYSAVKAFWDANRIVMWPAERAEYVRNTSALRTQLDEVSWHKAWAEGSVMSIEQAIEYAVEGGNVSAQRNSPG